MVGGNNGRGVLGSDPVVDLIDVAVAAQIVAPELATVVDACVSGLALFAVHGSQSFSVDPTPAPITVSELKVSDSFVRIDRRLSTTFVSGRTAIAASESGFVAVGAAASIEAEPMLLAYSNGETQRIAASPFPVTDVWSTVVDANGDILALVTSNDGHRRVLRVSCDPSTGTCEVSEIAGVRMRESAADLVMAGEVAVILISPFDALPGDAMLHTLDRGGDRWCECIRLHGGTYDSAAVLQHGNVAVLSNLGEGEQIIEVVDIVERRRVASLVVRGLGLSGLAAGQGNMVTSIANDIEQLVEIDVPMRGHLRLT